jgi:N-acetylmuramoyl-L-alanine amidase
LRRWTLVTLLLIGLLNVPYIASAARVVVDPGHGGSDPGAIGINALQEKTVNTDISLKLKDILLAAGYEVIMTRENDRTMSLQERVMIARNTQADLFVSVHANAHPSSSARGTMVLYFDAEHAKSEYPSSAEMIAWTPQSRQLATFVLSSLLEAVPNTNRGLVPSSAYVLRNGNVPSILVETAFLSNHQDAKLLADEKVRLKYAQAIAAGIQQFSPLTFSDIHQHWAKVSIVRLYEQGITQGDLNRFFPDRPLTRAELAAFLQRSFGFSSPVQSASTLPSFTDLSTQHWAYTTVLHAANSGLFQGYPDGTIRPDDPVSRSEVAVVIDRLIGTSFTNNDDENSVDFPTFHDVPADDWAFASIRRLSREGIIQGIQVARFEPSRSVTRAEIATMVDRLLVMASRQLEEVASRL